MPRFTEEGITVKFYYASDVAKKPHEREISVMVLADSGLGYNHSFQYGDKAWTVTHLTTGLTVPHCEALHGKSERYMQELVVGLSKIIDWKIPWEDVAAGKAMPVKDFLEAIISLKDKLDHPVVQQSLFSFD